MMKKPHIRLCFGRWDWFINESRGPSTHSTMYSRATLWCRTQNHKEGR